MKILCSSDMPYAKEAFSTLGDTLLKKGRSINANDVHDASILAIRSTTRVDEALLAGSAVGFVGTATIGNDHMDIPYLERAGIKWVHSPGCNANSVSEYVASALLFIASRHGFRLEGKTIGVIGVGNVGNLVVQKAGSLGMRVLKNDPPRSRGQERQTTDDGRRTTEIGLFRSDSTPTLHHAITTDPECFVGLDELLAESDIVTLHVPLNKRGPDATWHLAGNDFFRKMKPGCVFINSARGAVVETDALLEAMEKGKVSHAVIDTWEGEPALRQDLLERVDLGTPHIAGYSFDGKVTGTAMVYRAACAFLGVKPEWVPDKLLPAPEIPEIRVSAAGRAEEDVLWEIVHRIYDITADDRRLRAGPRDDRMAAYFD
ncbi:MAG: 4-phosphoerythronate dehydrogenase, partial [Spirochaetales bacterium]